jgi:hypothetical protein
VRLGQTIQVEAVLAAVNTVFSPTATAATKIGSRRTRQRLILQAWLHLCITAAPAAASPPPLLLHHRRSKQRRYQGDGVPQFPQFPVFQVFSCS